MRGDGRAVVAGHGRPRGRSPARRRPRCPGAGGTRPAPSPRARTRTAARRRRRPRCPAISGVRRPRTSLSGPAITCPTATPMRHAVRVSCTWPVRCSSSSPAMAGSAGRYMSIERGPIADSAPRMSSSPLRRVIGATSGAMTAAVIPDPLFLAGHDGPTRARGSKPRPGHPNSLVTEISVKIPICNARAGGEAGAETPATRVSGHRIGGPADGPARPYSQAGGRGGPKVPAGSCRSPPLAGSRADAGLRQAPDRWSGRVTGTGSP